MDDVEIYRAAVDLVLSVKTVQLYVRDIADELHILAVNNLEVARLAPDSTSQGHSWVSMEQVGALYEIALNDPPDITPLVVEDWIEHPGGGEVAAVDVVRGGKNRGSAANNIELGAPANTMTGLFILLNAVREVALRHEGRVRG